MKENLRVVTTIDDISAEESAKEEELLSQERPDAELSRVKLVTVVLKVVSQERRVVVVVAVCCSRHEYLSQSFQCLKLYLNGTPG